MRFELPVDYEAYNKSLSEFMSVLTDLLLSNASLSEKTQIYILDRIDEYAVPITRFPETHPIFKAIAQSDELTIENAKRILELSNFDINVKAHISTNTALDETLRISIALSDELYGRM